MNEEEFPTIDLIFPVRIIAELRRIAAVQGRELEQLIKEAIDEKLAGLESEKRDPADWWKEAGPQ
jgi:hypothetical protein